MIERWSREQVLALAPDASSQKGAQSVSTPAKWPATGATPDVLWGECKGSGATPYRACVDLAEPAYRCTCPSRKFPCKHALGLLLLWSADGVPSADASPDWVTEWLEQRRARAAKAATPRSGTPTAGPGTAGHAGPGTAGHAGPGTAGHAGPGTAGHAGSGSGPGHAAIPPTGDTEGTAGEGIGAQAEPGAPGLADGGTRLADGGPGVVDGGPGVVDGGPGSADGGEPDRRAVQRERRVAAGLSELERWLADQIGQGLAGARKSAPAQWEELTRRLVDAQAPGVAGVVSRLPRVLAEEDWPARLLGEYGLLHLLAVGYRRAPELPAPLRDTVRSRVGFPTSREEVLAGATVRDHWHVLGSRDEEQDRLVSRRVWLRGRTSGRFALVLSFAPPGQALDASLVTGTVMDAELAFYPGAAPLRVLVAVRHQAAPSGPPPGAGARAALDELAAALAADPWLESWPVVLTDVVPARRADRWLLADLTPAPDDRHNPGADRHGPGGNRQRPGDDEHGPGSECHDTRGELHGSGGERHGSQSERHSPDGDRHGALDEWHGPGGARPGLLGGMPLHASMGVPWRLLAVSGGEPVTVAAEWTPGGLRLLTTWDEENRVVVL
ncbi:SWIM zinc finger family protein [Sphaerisporangium sp. NPDC005288]|uniref:SWIM zinc finger family protein n=1 Tax=Sphaerisporangium sp. NPDC005288 TaxID=3155114 RepID=UPI0033AD32EE